MKPYELRELLARVRSVLRRLPQPADVQAMPAPDSQPSRRIFSFGDYHADLDGRLITGPGGAVIDMAKSEFDMLEVS